MLLTIPGLLATAQVTNVTSTNGAGPLVVQTKFKSGFGWNTRALETNDPAVTFWLESSLRRVYPASRPQRKTALRLDTPRNARFSLQACLRNERSWPLDVECAVSAPQGLKVQVRRVGFVPQWNYTGDTPPVELDGAGYVPGLVPDPLYPESRALVGPYGTQPFWISVQVPPDATPGKQVLSVQFKSSDLDEPVSLSMEIEILPLVVRERENFPVAHWWCADAIYDWYRDPVLGDEWLSRVRPYLTNMLDHGSDVIMVPMLYVRREIVARPPQLLIVTEPEPGEYRFDWSRVKKFVDTAKEIGFRRFEWSHFWSYKVDPSKASVDTPTRIYKWVDGKAELLWPKDTEATGPMYRNFLSQFMPEFNQFLQQEGIRETSYFHLSDEPGGDERDVENYRKARELLKELAPWMKVIDAMSDTRYGKQGLTDIPVPALHAAQPYIDEKIPHWVYYCMGPRGPYLNRFFDTPLAKIRMSGMVFYRLGALGFLHWGYNYWYVMDLSFNPKTQVLVDPFTDGASGTSAGGGGAPYGDAFVVYPGTSGPIDSIRWEIFAESLQDYAILQTLGIKPDDERLSTIKDYARFPKSEEWIQSTLSGLMRKGKAQE